MDNSKEFWNLFVNRHQEPCYLADIDTLEVLTMNDSMEKLLGGKEEYLGKVFYAVIKDEVKINDREFRWMKPEFDWQNHNIHQQQIYDSTLDMSFHATAIPISFGTSKYLFIECIPILESELGELNMEQGIAKALSIIQNGTDVRTSLLQLLSHFYDSERAFIHEINVEEQEIRLSSSWESISGLDVTRDVSEKFPVASILKWMNTN